MNLHIINVTLNGTNELGLKETYTVALIATQVIYANHTFANDQGVFSPKKFKDSFKVARIRWATSEKTRDIMTEAFIAEVKHRVNAVDITRTNYVYDMQLDDKGDLVFKEDEYPLMVAVIKYLALYMIPDYEERKAVYSTGIPVEHYRAMHAEDEAIAN